jgi:hypothetical protein
MNHYSTNRSRQKMKLCDFFSQIPLKSSRWPTERTDTVRPSSVILILQEESFRYFGTCSKGSSVGTCISSQERGPLLQHFPHNF